MTIGGFSVEKVVNANLLPHPPLLATLYTLLFTLYTLHSTHFPLPSAKQISLGVESGLAARTSGHNGLAVGAVHHIAASENAWHIGARRVGFGQNVAVFVGLYKRLKNSTIRVMTDSKEESVNLNLTALLVGRSLTVNQIGTFNNAIAKQV